MVDYRFGCGLGWDLVICCRFGGWNDWFLWLITIANFVASTVRMARSEALAFVSRIDGFWLWLMVSLTRGWFSWFVLQWMIFTEWKWYQWMILDYVHLTSEFGVFWISIGAMLDVRFVNGALLWDVSGMEWANDFLNFCVVGNCGSFTAWPTTLSYGVLYYIYLT